MLKTNKIVSLILAVVLVVSMFTIAFTSTAALSDGETWTVAGAAGLCGSEWDPGDSNNRMSYNPENGNYEKVFTGIAAGTYEFKVINGIAWDNPEFNLTGSANYGGGNASVTVTADGSTVLVGCDGSKAYVSVTAGGDTPVDPT
ncbi:MAG: hypothetical protein Q4A12_05635, partial [Eubacteriales bacterium]|nr:hypothetical protein [Eubacteriales bacterium]